MGPPATLYGACSNYLRQVLNGTIALKQSTRQAAASANLHTHVYHHLLFTAVCFLWATGS